MVYFIIGVAAFAYGNINLFASRLGWQQFLGPRDRLRKKHGQERGDAFFMMSYVVLPLLVAAVAIWRGMYPV